MGLSTVWISVVPGLTSRINPPRTVLTRFPLGRVTGPPFDRDLQATVVSAAFDALRDMSQPGTIQELSYQYPTR